MKACMGGFCRLREKCRHHVSPGNRQRPAERLCSPGSERGMFFVPLKEAPKVEVPAEVDA
jgi:hypothetical protein